MDNSQVTSAGTIQEFKLPDLGEGMHEAEIRRWHVKAGDTLKLDQPMVEVETDKAVVEIPSPVTGRVSAIRVFDGQIAQVGDVLVVFEPSTKSVSSGQLQESLLPDANRPATTSIAEQPVSMPQTTTPRQRVLAAPATRKLAFELGVDLEQVTPSSANGRVSLEDVRAYAERAKAPTTNPTSAQSLATPESSSSGETSLEPGQPQGLPLQQANKVIDHVESSTNGKELLLIAQVTVQDEHQPLTGLRKRIAEHMQRSWRTIPHATAFGELDGTGLVALRTALKPLAEQRGIHLTYMPFLIKLLLPVLKEFPIFNASLDEERNEIIYKRSYHIGIATAAPEGLLVPVMRNADKLSLASIAGELERLVEGARKRTLPLSELTGSTFTLNNVGSFGGGSGTPIINYPEVAILALGRLEEKPVVRHGAITIQPMMPLALSFDHRLIDGAMSGAFLARFKELVENPQQLILDMI